MGIPPPKSPPPEKGGRRGEKEGRKRGTPVEEPEAALCRWHWGPHPGAAGLPFVEKESGAGVGEEEEKRKRESGHRRPTKPELLRKDTNAVNPEDRSASAAMDALNIDQTTTPYSAECPNSDLFCFLCFELNHRRSGSPSSPPFTAASRTPRRACRVPSLALCADRRAVEGKLAKPDRPG
jgi:hypothetical protein